MKSPLISAGDCEPADCQIHAQCHWHMHGHYCIFRLKPMLKSAQVVAIFDPPARSGNFFLSAFEFVAPDMLPFTFHRIASGWWAVGLSYSPSPGSSNDFPSPRVKMVAIMLPEPGLFRFSSPFTDLLSIWRRNPQSPVHLTDHSRKKDAANALNS